MKENSSIPVFSSPQLLGTLLPSLQVRALMLFVTDAAAVTAVTAGRNAAVVVGVRRDFAACSG